MRRKLSILLFVVCAATAFFVLDQQGISLGDDMGYMFTDSRLHKGDGHLVGNLTDIVNTQLTHYQHTNGRFLVHSIVMFFLAIASRTLFCVANALVFVTLVTLTARYTGRGKLTVGGLSFVMLMLWLCLPQPGVVMLSLVAFAVNYLWSATVLVGILLLWQRLKLVSISRLGVIGVVIIGLIAGAWQESFSIPLSTGMFLWLVGHQRSAPPRLLILATPYWLGAIAIACAPGNIHRILNGEEAGTSSLADKLASLSPDLLYSPISVVVVCVIVYAIVNHRGCGKFIRANMMEMLVLATALVLAAFTYTAKRQLYCPAIVSCILLLRLMLQIRPTGRLVGKRWFACLTLLINVAIIAGAWQIRVYPRQLMDQVISQTSSGGKIIILEGRSGLESGAYGFMFNRFNDDIYSGRQLPLMFDGYTKRGLGRLYSPSHQSTAVLSFLPDRILALKEKAARSENNGTEFRAVPIDDYYSIVAVGSAKVKRTDGRHFRCEQFTLNDSTYYIVPSDCHSLTKR